MVWLFLLNDQHCVALGEGHLPSNDYLRKFWRSLALDDSNGNLRGLSRDLLAALAINTITRHYTISQQYEPSEMPLETWVISPNPDGYGRLAEWFKNVPSPQEYRVLIHHNPARYRGRQVGLDIWYPAYRSLGIRPDTTHLEDLKDPACDFLEDMLTAYGVQPTAPETVMRTTGHPYCLCRNRD